MPPKRFNKFCANVVDWIPTKRTPALIPKRTGCKNPPTIEAIKKIANEAINIPIAKLSLRNGTLESKLVTVAKITGVINIALATAIISFDFRKVVKLLILRLGVLIPRTILIIVKKFSICLDS